MECRELHQSSPPLFKVNRLFSPPIRTTGNAESQVVKRSKSKRMSEWQNEPTFLIPFKSRRFLFGKRWRSESMGPNMGVRFHGQIIDEMEMGHFLLTREFGVAGPNPKKKKKYNESSYQTWGRWGKGNTMRKENIHKRGWERGIHPPSNDVFGHRDRARRIYVCVDQACHQEERRLGLPQA